MTNIYGADSAYPQPGFYAGREAWQVYVFGDTPHVWSRAEVAELSSHGVKGVIPTVVPSQNEAWWEGDVAGYLRSLRDAAVKWGVPGDCPLEIDIEGGQANAMGGSRGNVAYNWHLVCHESGHIGWIYSSAYFFEMDVWTRRRLAAWPSPTPSRPNVPNTYHGWQYAGNVEGAIDLDVWLPSKFMKPNGSGVVELGSSGVAGAGPAIAGTDPVPLDTAGGA